MGFDYKGYEGEQKVVFRFFIEALLIKSNKEQPFENVN